MNRSTTILIADDHPVFRSGLRTVLAGEPRLSILHETGRGDLALQLIRQSKPDIAILDIEMPVMDGFEVARTVAREELAVDIIFMTMHNDEQTFNKALDVGVKGYVLKENAVSDILESITAVASGRYYMSPSLSDYLLKRSAGSSRPSGQIDAINALTPSEKRIFLLIAEQRTSKSIAEELFISPKTVEKHRSNISSKLGLKGAYSLLKFAMEHKGEL